MEYEYKRTDTESEDSSTENQKELLNSLTSQNEMTWYVIWIYQNKQLRS